MLTNDPRRRDSARPAGLEDACYDFALAESFLKKTAEILPPQLIEAKAALSEWISSILESVQGRSRSVTSFGFERLRDYFPAPLLLEARVVIVPHCPQLPLQKLGLPELDLPSGSAAGGIAFRNTYFVAAENEQNERLHFHELVHVVQWKILGEEAFLQLYGAGLLQEGYANSPLEAMAYDLDRRFQGSRETFDAIKEIHGRLKELGRA